MAVGQRILKIFKFDRDFLKDSIPICLLQFEIYICLIFIIIMCIIFPVKKNTVTVIILVIICK